MSLNDILTIETGGRPPVLLAPMAGVTDLPFRVICRGAGADFSYTEMVSAKGLAFKNRNTEDLLAIAPAERPSGAQLFGSDPAVIGPIAAEVSRRPGVAVIDLNMGCPAKKITGNMDGSALMRDLPLAARVIVAAARASAVPVTVKFRKGWDAEHVNCAEFARMAEESGAAALTVHGRTREQLYSGLADRDAIAAAVAAVDIPVIANGDISGGASALSMLADTGAAGLMIGRAAIGDPFVFGEIRAALEGRTYTPPTDAERIAAALRHLRAHCEYYGGAAFTMRSQLSHYIKGMPGAVELRRRLFRAGTEDEMRALLIAFREGRA